MITAPMTRTDGPIVERFGPIVVTHRGERSFLDIDPDCGEGLCPFHLAQALHAVSRGDSRKLVTTLWLGADDPAEDAF